MPGPSNFRGMPSAFPPAKEPKMISSLLELVEPDITNIYLNPSTTELVNELILEWRNKESFSKHNLMTRMKILLHGPTGNGKTSIAKFLAAAVELPMYEVRTEGVISSYQGKSGSNVEEVLKSLDEPCVLFWDEIDSIALSRTRISGDSSVENIRMVNAFLVNLEKLHDDIIFIAATNLMEKLDPAVVRRFDVKFEVVPPTEEEKVMFADGLKNYYRLTTADLRDINFDDLDSYCDIADFIKDRARAHVRKKIMAKQNQTPTNG